MRKPLLTEFGIQQRWESCVHLVSTYFFSLVSFILTQVLNFQWSIKPASKVLLITKWILHKMTSFLAMDQGLLPKLPTLIKPSPPWVDFVECPPRIVGHENRPWRLVDQLFTCWSCVGYENRRPDARLPVNENPFPFIGLLQLWETRYIRPTDTSI